jgi:hypothetical protein
MIEFLCEDRQTLCHGFGEVLIVLQGLHDVDLSSESMPVVLHSDANDFVDMHANGLELHVLFGLGNAVSRMGEAPERRSIEV